jgi:hypothetical protein
MGGYMGSRSEVKEISFTSSCWQCKIHLWRILHLALSDRRCVKLKTYMSLVQQPWQSSSFNPRPFSHWYLFVSSSWPEFNKFTLKSLVYMVTCLTNGSMIVEVLVWWLPLPAATEE